MNVPLAATYLMAPGSYPGMSRTVVRLTSQDGAVGLGETPSAADADLLLEGLAGELIGVDVSEARRRLAGTAPRAGVRDDGRVIVQNALAGVEMALWDCEARAAGLPLVELLGGACRSEIGFTEYFAPRPGREETPEELAAYCARMVDEHGSPSFEGKVAVRPPEDGLETIRLIREAIGPERPLRLDANMGWSLETAREVVPALAELRISNVEEPVAGLDDLRRLRERSAIPTSAHRTDLENVAASGVPDALVLGIAACGGIAGTMRFVADCERAGVRFWFYSGDLGIATAAVLHLAAAVPYLDLPSQSLRRWTADDVVAEGPFAPERGVLAIPPGPGLGVHLDDAGLRRGVERFAREGEYDLYTGPPLPRY